MTKKSPTKQQVPIEWAAVDKYLAGGAKGTEIAAALGIHYDTLADRCKAEFNILFSEYSAKKRQKGNMMLHVKQYQTAMTGNVPMLIWLGKQRLGQTDQPRGKDEFNGSLANLLDVMHLIKTAEDFEALVYMAKDNKPKVQEGIKC